MHPKNPFAADYNFNKLTQHYPPLQNFVFTNQYGNKTIKFGNPQAVKALNSALLKHQYGINWDIPANNLCPPIPGRLDYLLHIADLFQKTDLRLLDIGTGANLIYPILATCHFNWQCTGSEVDKESLKNAQALINKNSQLQKIDLRHQPFKRKILEQLILPTDVFDVVVCNPPFYKNAYEARQKNQRKVANLQLDKKESLNFGGRSTELWYKGGELAFVKRMVLESNQFKSQVQWFTSLVSNKDNVKRIKRAINKFFPTEIRVVEMEQGHKKSRFVAWTFW